MPSAPFFSLVVLFPVPPSPAFSKSCLLSIGGREFFRLDPFLIPIAKLDGPLRPFPFHPPEPFHPSLRPLPPGKASISRLPLVIARPPGIFRSMLRRPSPPPWDLPPFSLTLRTGLRECLSGRTLHNTALKRGGPALFFHPPRAASCEFFLQEGLQI